MSTYKLIPYKVKVRKKFAKDKPQNRFPLQSIPTGQNNSTHIVNLIEEFCTDQRIIQLEEIEKTLYFPNGGIDLDLDQKTISGLMKLGEYGVNADFLHLDEDQPTIEENARTIHDSETLPFYFLFHAPSDRPTAENPKEGYLILQRFKNMGAKGVFASAFVDYFKSTYIDDITFSFNPIISHDLIDQIQSADRIFELQLVKKEVPRSTTSKILIDNDNVKEKRTFVGLGESGLNFNLGNLEDIRQILTNVEYLDNTELEDTTYYDDVKIRLEEGGSQNTIRIAKRPEFKEALVLDEDELEFREDGHPQMSALQEKSVSYMNKILERENEAAIYS